MQSYYGWKNASMTLEYVSTSKAAIEDMAAKLAHSESEDKVTNSELEDKVTGPNSALLMAPQVVQCMYCIVCIVCIAQAADTLPTGTGDLTHSIDGKKKIYILYGGVFNGNYV